MKRSRKPAATSSGSITVMLYQMLNALPTRCGMRGAKETTRNGCRFNAASMAENNRAESNVRAGPPSFVRARSPESLSFFQKQIRDRTARTCRPGDLEKCSAAVIVALLRQIARGCPAMRHREWQDRHL